MSSSKRTLIWLKPQFLGDAVMAAPVIDALTESGRAVTIRAEPHVLSLFDDRKDVCEQLPTEKIVRFPEVLFASKQLRARKFDEAIVLDRSFRSALVVFLASIRVRSGHETEGRSWLLTNHMPYDLLRNESESFLDLVRCLNIETNDIHPLLRVSEGEVKKTEDMVTGPTVGFQPGARYQEKQYPILSLACVARRAKEMGYSVAALGGENEKSSASEFLELCGGGIDLTGRLPIRSSMSILSRLSAMIGSDTGLMHIAAALGVPTVTMFGPNPASKWGHSYSPHEVLVGEYGETGAVTIDEVISAMSSALSRNVSPTN